MAGRLLETGVLAEDVLDALEEAARLGHVEFARFLAKAAVFRDPPQYIVDGALSNACREGQIDMVRFLLEFAGDENGPRDSGLYLEHIWGGLNAACGHGHFDIVRLLLERKDAETPSWATESWAAVGALEGACAGGHIDVVRLMLQAGACVSRQAWAAAMGSGDPELTSMVNQRFADPQNTKGLLSLAARRFSGRGWDVQLAPAAAAEVVLQKAGLK